MGKKKSPAKGSRHGKYSSRNSGRPLMIMAAVLAVLAIWIVYRIVGAGSPAAPAPLAGTENGVQVISMDLSTAGYSPNNFTVKKGVPVQVKTNATADAGCVRGLMIPDFNINKALAIGPDSFTFTPDKTGTFTFTCQMKMSTGTLRVI